jgi:hypothetical protein
MNSMDYHLHSFLQSKGGPVHQFYHRSSYLQLQLVGGGGGLQYRHDKGNELSNGNQLQVTKYVYVIQVLHE